MTAMILENIDDVEQLQQACPLVPTAVADIRMKPRKNGRTREFDDHASDRASKRSGMSVFSAFLACLFFFPCHISVYTSLPIYLCVPMLGTLGR